MKSFASLAGVLVVLASVAALETRAEACTPAAPGLSGSVPKSGVTYPANAALLFYGHEISLDAVSVTVDGQPASLVAAPDADALGIGGLTARIEPEPAKGQMVTVTGDFCKPMYMCEPMVLSFVAGEADTAAPASPTAISFDLYDYPDFMSSGGDCQSDSDLGWWVDVDTAPPAASESLVVLKVEAFQDESFGEVVFRSSRFVDAATASVALHYTVSVLAGEPAPEAFCFRASVSDLAGHAASETVHVCRPCHYRKEGGMSESVPSEPSWTDADIYPGGSCDAGNGTGGAGGDNTGAGDTGGDGGEGGKGGAGGTDNDAVVGCGCRLAGGESAVSGSPERRTSNAAYSALTLLAAVAAARMRRRHRS